jgi:hypothetical protein
MFGYFATYGLITGSTSNKTEVMNVEEKEVVAQESEKEVTAPIENKSTSFLSSKSEDSCIMENDPKKTNEVVQASTEQSSTQASCDSPFSCCCFTVTSGLISLGIGLYGSTLGIMYHQHTINTERRTSEILEEKRRTKKK